MELPPPDPDGMDPNQAQPQAHHRTPFPARTRACHFDGNGNSHTIAFNLNSSSAHGPQFNWYHIELPKTSQKLSISAQTLISLLCPPLKLQDILSLASAGPFCGLVDGALIFRLNSSSTLRLAARVTENSVVSVSLGRVPRLGFVSTGRSLLSEIPRLEGTRGGGVEIGEELLESLLGMNFEGEEDRDAAVPRRAAELLVHVVDVHVDQVQDAVMKFEMELDSVELELDRGGSALKKQMLDDRKFAKMHLNLQRLLQVVAHGEQVFPRVKEKCAAKGWFVGEDIVAFEELISRLRRLKENLGFIVNRVTAVQAGLDSWQAEQINRKLYYLSFLSIIILPLSIVTGVFGMNVGGVPWTEQKDPLLKDGFLNVMLICAGIVFILLLSFAFPFIYSHISSWRGRWTLPRSYSRNRKSLRRYQNSGHQGGGYTRI